MSDPYLGEIRMVGFNFPPRGWAFCDGSILSRSQNTALFSIFGTTYGGNGITNFALPNLLERTPIHYGQGTGLTSRALGENGGENQHALTNAEIPHSHALMGVSNPASTNVPNASALAQASTTLSSVYRAATNLTTMDTSAVGTTGSNNGHQNMQPFLAITFIVALEGIYPS